MNKKQNLKSGIYRIHIYEQLGKPVSKDYIGQSLTIFKRWEQHLRSIKAETDETDVKLYKELKKKGTKYTFEIIELCDEKDLDLREAYWIKYYGSKNSESGLNSTRGNHVELLEKQSHSKSTKEYCASMRIIPIAIQNRILDLIQNYLKYNISKLNICFIADSYLAYILKTIGAQVKVYYNNSEYLTDTTENCMLANERKLISKTKEDILKEVRSMDNFDLIIMNPPYDPGLGDTIIKEALKHSKQIISLNPKKLLKNKELYKHVSSIEAVDASSFEDANIGDGLTISVLEKDLDNGKSWEEINALGMKKEYHEFALLNIKGKSMFKAYRGLAYWEEYKVNPATWFVCGVRTGAHWHLSYDKNAFDYRWNVLKDSAAVKPATNASGVNNVMHYNLVRFNTELEHTNFTKFAFAHDCGRGGINTFNELLKMSASVSSIAEAIPNIDWSKERDYENLTVENLVEILKEENNL